MQKLFLTLAYTILLLNGYSQSFSDVERLQGYAISGDSAYFVFDEATYGLKPTKVIVTGEFRGWDANMNVPQWDLVKSSGIWILAFDNTDQAVIRPNVPFKFRIDDGEWLEPPAGAPNSKSGNLVFSPQVITKSLNAEITADGRIWADILGDRPSDPTGYKITDARGNELPVAFILPNDARQTLIIPAEPLDRNRPYYLEIPSLELKTLCSFDGWFRNMVSTKELGANVHDDGTSIRLFAPRAEMVKLYLYNERTRR